MLAWRAFGLVLTPHPAAIMLAAMALDVTLLYPYSKRVVRMPQAVLGVGPADVVSLGSASRIRAFLEEGGTRDRVRIVVNRYKKIPGFTDEDVEKATSCKLLWKIPNNYQSIAPAIDKGVPVALQENTDIVLSFRSLASALAHASPTSAGASHLFSRPETAAPTKTTSEPTQASP